jgi:hypothetical protein
MLLEVGKISVLAVEPKFCIDAEEVVSSSVSTPVGLTFRSEVSALFRERGEVPVDCRETNVVSKVKAP